MADSGIIHEFLVALGFKVDEGGAARFDATIRNSQRQSVEFDKTLAAVGKQLGILGDQLLHVSDRPAREAVDASERIRKHHLELEKQVKSLGFVAIGTAGAFVASFTEIARQYEKLYYISQRSGISAQNLSGLQFAGPQVGLNSNALVAAMDAVTTAARNPAVEAFIRGFLHADPKNLNSIIDGLAKLPDAWQRDFAAQQIGLDAIVARTLVSNKQIFEQADADWKRFLHEAGVNENAQAKMGRDIASRWEELWAHMGVIAKQSFGEAYPALDAIVGKIDELTKATAIWNASHPFAATAEVLASMVVSATALLRLAGLIPGSIGIAAGTVGKVIPGVGLGIGLGSLLPSVSGPSPLFKGPEQFHKEQMEWLSHRSGFWDFSFGGMKNDATSTPHYAGGGIVPHDQHAYLHKDEMVLPEQISMGLQHVIAGFEGSAGGGAGFHEWLSGNSSYQPYVRVVGFDPNANYRFGTDGTGFGTSLDGSPRSPLGTKQGERGGGVPAAPSPAATAIAPITGPLQPNPRSTIPQAPAGPAPAVDADVRKIIAESGLSPQSQALVSRVAEKEAHGFNVLAGGSKFDTSFPDKPGYAGFPQWGGFHHQYHGRDVVSHGAGLFQFEPGTWKDVADKHGLTNFRDPRQQVLGAEYLLHDLYAKDTRGRDLEADLKSGQVDPRGFTSELSRNTWAALHSGSWRKALTDAPPVAGLGVVLGRMSATSLGADTPSVTNNNAGDRTMTVQQTNHIALNGAHDAVAAITARLDRHAGDILRQGKAVLS